MRCAVCITLLVAAQFAVAAPAWYWGPFVEITHAPDTGYTNSNNARCIAAADGLIHVAMVGDIFVGNRYTKEVYYTRSLDWGLNWSALYRLSDSDGVDSRPVATTLWSKDTLMVVYADSIETTGDDTVNAYSRVSCDTGTTWSAKKEIEPTKASSA
jgi:hypothetical protein